MSKLTDRLNLGNIIPISTVDWYGKAVSVVAFRRCPLRCVYCQNYKFSQIRAFSSEKINTTHGNIHKTGNYKNQIKNKTFKKSGESPCKEVTKEELAEYMIDLQKKGCHNINLVTPAHVIPQILKALPLAITKGLTIPLVYNTSGYELSETIKLLEDIVDIFLADMRYSESETAVKYSQAPDYPLYNQAAVKQMYKQVKTAQIDNNGLIKKGLIIRHLVLPNDIAGTHAIMCFIANELSPQTHISLMSQYLPCYKAKNIRELSRKISKQEYIKAQQIMRYWGLNNGWFQQLNAKEELAGIHIKPMVKP